MAADAEGEATPGEQWLKQGAQVGDEAVVAGDQLGELASRREVLILEALRLAAADGPQRRSHDLFVDLGQRHAHAGKEAADRGEALLDGPRRTGGQRAGRP